MSLVVWWVSGMLVWGWYVSVGGGYGNGGGGVGVGGVCMGGVMGWMGM